MLGCKLRIDRSALGLLHMRMRPHLSMGGFPIHVALGSLSDWQVAPRSSALTAHRERL